MVDTYSNLSLECRSLAAVTNERGKLSFPPSWLLIISCFSFVISMTVLFLGAWKIGVTWDEKTQVAMLQTYLDQGWHVTSDALLGDGLDPNYIFGVFVYGPVGELLPHSVAVLLGQETWGVQELTAGAYSARHVGIALTAVIGIAAVLATVRMITRSWRWALLGGAITSSIPLWIGHGMMNIKDLPTAVGYTIATMGLVALFRNDYFANRWARITAILGIGFGAVLAAGTRPAIGLPIAGTIVFVSLWALLLSYRNGDPWGKGTRILRRFVEAVAAISGGYAILVLIYPKAFLDPINLGIKAVLESALYPMSEAQLTAGAWMVQPVSWSYLPLWFGAQLPLLILFGSLMAVLFWVLSNWKLLIFPRNSRTARASTNIELNVQALPVLMQAGLLPLAAIVGSSTLYNGTRQMLFVVPAAAILATLGVWKLTQILKARDFKGWLTTLGIVVAFGIIVPAVSQVLLFPYSYTYFNAIASVAPIDRNWPTDYWRASGNELWRAVPEGGLVSCAFEQLQKGEIFLCDTQGMFQPFLEELGKNAVPTTLRPNEYWFLQENNGVLDLPSGCRPFYTLTKPLFWQQITIGQIAICDSTVDTGQRNLQDPSQPIR